MRIIKDDKHRKLAIIIMIPVLLIAQYYLFKFGILKPMIKGVEIKIINGDYIQDIDKYVIRLGEEVTLSSGDYIKIPNYAKDPDISFKILDNNKSLKIIENSDKEENTATLIGIKKGYSSIAIVKDSRVLKKATVLVVDPQVENLNLQVDGSLVFVGDSAKINSSVEVDYKRFKDSYEVTYESSNEDILKIEDNEVKAVGVGSATIYAKSGDKVDSIRYKINAKVEKMEIDDSIELGVGSIKKIQPKIITNPRGLKNPDIEYQLLESKLPIERSIRLDPNGTIVGLREGEEKVLVSCGVGWNKKSKIITVKVVKEPLINQSIQDLISSYDIEDNKMIITLTWSSISEIFNYDIYLKNNSLGEEYSLVKSIIMDKIDLDNESKIKTTIEVDISDLKDIDLDIYVVGVTDKGNTNISNITNIKHSIEEIEEDVINLIANIDKDDNIINLEWNSIDNCEYNIYIKDMAEGNDEFKLLASNLIDTNYTVNISENIDIEIYVCAISNGNEIARSDIKVFK
ncbi:Ig-like domain-containing protein [Romboutsia sp. 1001713B170207_170306_H8]|uniref:Ig-like domain-containing protein n=2 Tax=unclassified Romboutsia TaxID=2626894 RepID=UPI001899F4F1|nr:Ig-like domain-containing protein [Romboutsia sp. 1001713B170207_170306_H8]